MAVQITSDNFEEYFLQTQENITESLEQSNGEVDIAMVTDLETIKAVLSLPGVKYDEDPTVKSDAKAVNYVQIPYKVLATAIEQANTAAQSATSAASSVQDVIDDAEQATSDANTAAQNANTSRQQIEANESTRQGNESTRQSNEATRVQNETGRVSAEQTRASTFASDHSTATSDHTTAETDHTTAQSDHSTAATDHTTAQSDHTASTTATAGAEKVNAQLSQQGGAVILTVTNRNGSPTSKEVGFRIAKTYSSIEAMKADAANVDDGRFTLIASNVEDPDNAKLYVRASDQQTEEPKGFSFLTDLSGAQGIKGDTPVMTADSDGVIYADGTKLTEVLKNAVDTFLSNEGTTSSAAGSNTRWGQYKSAEASRNTSYQSAEGTSSSAAGNGSRWGSYKSAESSRDSQYSTAEGNRNTSYQTAEDARDAARLNAEGTSSSTAGDGTRWGAYQSAETARNTSYAGAEGTSTSTAGDGTRWGTFKTNETQRQSDFNTAQTSRNTTWTEWFSDTLATGVRKIWNTWYNATMTAWDNWFGTSTSTGVQGDWSTLRQDVVAKTNAANTAAAGASNVNATLSGSVLTVTDRNGQDTVSDVRGPQGVKGDKGDKGDNLDWESMTEEEKQALAQEVLSNIGFDDIPTESSDNAVKSGGLYSILQFASTQTCKDVVTELTEDPVAG